MQPITLDFTFWDPKRRLERITVQEPELAIDQIKDLLMQPEVSGVQMTVQKSHRGEHGF